MAGRYRVTVTIGGVLVIQGWRDERATADSKFTPLDRPVRRP